MLRHDDLIGMRILQWFITLPLINLVDHDSSLGRSASVNCLLSAAIACLTSLSTAMCAYLFLLSSDGSMSMWTILPCLQNSATLPSRDHQIARQMQGVSQLHPLRNSNKPCVHAQHAERERSSAG